MRDFAAERREVDALEARYWNQTLAALHHFMDKPGREHSLWGAIVALRVEYEAKLEQIGRG